MVIPSMMFPYRPSPAPLPREHRRRLQRRPGRAIALVAAGVLAGFVLARLLSPAAARRGSANPYQKLSVFARVLSYVETEYVDAVDRDRAIEDAIRGLLRHLDPHTQFYSATQVKQLRTTLTGRYSGVGLSLSRRGGKVVVLNAAPGGPAGRAGVRPGDRLLAIDGAPVRRQDLATLTTRLRGRRGTRVVLTVRSRGAKNARRLTLVRDVIRRVDVLKAALPRRLGYLAVRRFSHGAARAARKAIATLVRSHRGKSLRGLVLDLRDNPGGLMDEGIRLADHFLSKGLIVRKEGKRGRLKERENAHVKGTLRRLPLVVLINRGTASAAEIVAAALADHKRARLVGEKTFGKGSMQSIIPLPDGSRLKLTIARYFRPSGKAIDGVGVTPDVNASSGKRAPPAPPVGALTPADRLERAPRQLPSWIEQDKVILRAIANLKDGGENTR